VGLDFVIDDPSRVQVGEPALEAVPDLDPHLPVVPGDKEDDAVIKLLLPDLPGLGDLHGILLQHFALEGRDGEHDDLRGIARFKPGEPRLEGRGRHRLEHVRVVVDAPLQGRHVQRGERERGQHREEQETGNRAYHGSLAVNRISLPALFWPPRPP